MDVYQRNWGFDEDNIKDYFDVDASIGRELTFQIDVSREKSTDECSEDIEMVFQIPGEQELKKEKFKCSKSNFGVYTKDLSSYTAPGPAPEGRWVYRITRSSAEKVAVSVKVRSKSRDPSTDPVLTRCWIATGSQAINSEADLKLSVVAEVRQGNQPVIGAKVHQSFKLSIKCRTCTMSKSKLTVLLILYLK